MTTIELDGVEKHFPKETGLKRILTRQPSKVKAVNGVSFQVDAGEIMGLVGESGCGKTTVAKLIMRIHDLTDGAINLQGDDIYDKPRDEYFKKVQMVFQDPYNTLNPHMNVYDQIKEPLLVQGFNDIENRIKSALEFSGLKPVENYLYKYPHELSGGEKQRVAIASAIAPDPAVIIADEPVSMLDVSIRAGILKLFKKLSQERDVSIIYISHDLSTVRYICQSVVVMYLGSIMEKGPVDGVFEKPAHPYTERLLSATPNIDTATTRERVTLNGQGPDSLDLPSGCYFKGRCKFANEACEEEDMNLRPPDCSNSENREVACHRAEKGDINWEELDDTFRTKT